MKNEQIFLFCEKCGNLAGLIQNAGQPLMCCGEKMKQLEANNSDGAGEKHLPIIERNGNEIKVTVGVSGHPMEEDHSISWIYLQTQKGGQRKTLKYSVSPSITFALKNDEPVAAFAYCNKHGLWKTNV